MSITGVERDGAFHFHVQGDMTFGSVKGLLQQSAGLFSSVQALEIDLTQVDRADSAGLALILEWKAQAVARDAKVVFTGMPDSIIAIARLCQVESLLDEANAAVC
ncbi:MAG: STAS domain-containing protein [Candidatus Thiodiazotropha sp. (ex Dulcina madagascariensis)]|nr:STAS domain-containing protein [Candidatus Thiodiazotropha sp. (ex Dulcina madagascariensis)]MCU7926187.1 STAS domain-containing protein [Candidatus Thiodiazotropha sp. (ex Dulcina madagascariensis)]